MGGIFSAPSPPAPPPMPAAPDPDTSERDRRLNELERRRRGRKGTVETGFRGVLSENDRKAAPDTGGRGKTFLGE